MTSETPSSVAMSDNWRGSVLRRPGRANLYVQVLDAGQWKRRATPYPDTPEGWQKATALLAEVRDALQARQRVLGDEPGPLTVRRWARRWLDERHALGVDRRHEDGGIVDGHILPAIGDLRLDEVRPRHMVELVRRLRAAGLAPRTVRNVYSIARSLFRDARLAEVTEASPCILTHHQLGKVRDAKPEWRAAAVYSRDELEALISDDRLPLARRALYAVLGLTGARYGEAAGLRWRHLDLDAKPLGRILIATSYDHGQTKTGAERRVPVHPTLAAMLAEWRLSGWPTAFLRQPGPDDLVFPVMPQAPRKGPRKVAGSMQDKNYIRKRLIADLETLGFRLRRGHDMRRTFQSLCDEDGVERSIRLLFTHAPSRDVLDLYTTVQWGRMCAEMEKLQVRRRGGGTVAAIRGTT